jgi:hypothetical protein
MPSNVLLVEEDTQASITETQSTQDFIPTTIPEEDRTALADDIAGEMDAAPNTSISDDAAHILLGMKSSSDQEPNMTGDDQERGSSTETAIEQPPGMKICIYMN